MVRVTILLAAIFAALVSVPMSSAATFDFESLAPGTTFGPPAGHVPGDIVLSEWNVDLSVEVFTFGTYAGFNFAEVAAFPGPPESFFPPAVNPTHTLTLNNINALFDFTGVGFDVGRVEFEYADLGGEENFDINHLGRQEVPDLTSLSPYAGFNVSVTAIPIGSGFTGVVEIDALPGNRIESLLVGGQEFAIDNLSKFQLLPLGDTDEDGDVDIDDLNNVRNAFGKSGGPVLGDTDGDQDVDIDDLNNVRNNFGAAGRSVPEPAGIALALLGVAVCCTSSRRRKSQWAG